jgi:hypothetical protein
MSLIRWIEKPYVYIFYVLLRFYVDEWRATLVMCVFQFLIIGGLVCAIALATGHSLLLISKSTLVVVAIVIYALTQIVLVRGHLWKRYKSEFDQYSRAKSRIATIAVWVGIVVVSVASVSLIKTVVR